ncbi:hypothetical protein [Beggiatoa leptomitoformis]|uniref:DUF4124 domain-containing protein n=1 Tax=Beggiatoa leptomitoformis TaxID=288004 RepID=A0A2N9YEG4_9GAMM|nr:hypothetical protein [Beggiatoa leptomitoformis]ALG68846.2 hypothetical protein AL038_15505 [Beggiatoa leptomitoformis]AUI68785.2 hypothetical protein BLE401_08750 [Beggiatoa leptomitoformis]
MMKLNKLLHSALVTVCLLTVAPTLLAAGGGKQIKCWTTTDGVTECGDIVPPQYSQQGFSKYNDKGEKVEQVERAKTRAEIEAIKHAEQQKQEEEVRRQKQAEEDRTLLLQFAREEDIQVQREARLKSIESVEESITSYVKSLEKNLADLKKNLADAEKNPHVKASEKEVARQNLANVERRIADSQKTLGDKHQEKLQINKQYDEYTKRFTEIMARVAKQQENLQVAPDAAKATTPAEQQ